MATEIISRSISTKVLDQAVGDIKLTTPGSAVGLSTNCATEPGIAPRWLDTWMYNNRDNQVLQKLCLHVFFVCLML